MLFREPPMEADRFSRLIPFVRVSDLSRSISFYERLDFWVRATHESRMRYRRGI
jgi:hypothetical protein